MLISFNWLKQFVDLPDSITAEEVSEKLKLSTVEVEKVDNQGASLAKIVVGKIIKCEKHSNADKLKVCEVDVGNEKLNIVCGGSNVAEGQFVAVAPIGASVVWHGQGEPVVLTKTAIRGVESFGMICAAEEIGLGTMFPKESDREILDLSVILSAAKEPSDKLQPGTPFAEALGLTDAILEIDNKSLSNRPDLWGHYGLAREVAVLTNREVKKYETKNITPGKEVKIKISNVDPLLCSRYMAVAMGGIKITESPDWLKQRLLAVGLRPINNIVDITNFVMFDLGQPMHAFDAKNIPKTKIVVRLAAPGEKIITLDDQERELTSEMLVIASEEKPLAIAGVMGGVGSGVTNDTTEIVFESANFDAVSIRKTSAKLGLRTDSSARFEKSLDPNLCALALAKAVELTLAVCPEAKVISNIADEKHFRLQTGPLELPINLFTKKLGVEIPTKTIITILTRLGFTVVEKKKTLSIKIPTWRATKDISIVEDVVEEVARIYGYDKIPSVLPTQAGTLPALNTLRILEKSIRSVLANTLSYTESDNYAFVSRQQIEDFGDKPELYLELDNPLSKEKPYLRRHVEMNLLENALKNIEFKDKLKLFEIGKTFRSEEAGARVSGSGSELLPRQDVKLAGVFVAKKNLEPFWEAKRAVETLAEMLNLTWRYAPAEARALHPWMHPTRTTWVTIGQENLVVGTIFELHPSVGEKIGLKERVGFFSFNLTNLDAINGGLKPATNYQPLNSFPSVVRDVAFLVKQDATHEKIVSALSHADPLITGVELFDVYSGSKLSPSYKSMAYHLTLESKTKTLTAEEIESAVTKAENILKQKFSAEIR